MPSPDAPPGGRPTLDGALALVTGAGSGIGRAVALALASRGARTLLVGRRADALASTVRTAGEAGRGMEVRPLDVTDAGAVAGLAARISETSGRLDVLVHAAAAYAVGPMDRAPAESLDLLYRTNVRAPYVLTQSVLPLLSVARGQVVFVNSSVAFLSAGAGVSQYAATKFALRAIADSLRAEVNASGIRVLSIYPGRTATPMQEAVHEAEGRPYRPENLMQPEDVASVVLHCLELPRTAEVADIYVRPMRKL